MTTEKYTVNVLYPFDDNYAPYAGISITSLFENNRSADAINVYILGFGLSDDYRNRLSRTAQKYGRNMIFLDPAGISSYIDRLDMPSYRGASVAAARLFVADYLPEGIDRIIYLDSDTLIVGDITSLVNEDMDGCPVAMVADSVARKYKTFIGFADTEVYHNAGMILYDLGRWRELRCTERILEHIVNVRKNYEALDQDLINIVLKGQIKTILPAYDLQPFHAVYEAGTYLDVTGHDGYYSKEEIKQAVSSPVMLHCFRYLGMFPWHRDSVHPWRDDFNRYKQMSLWQDMPEATDSMKGFVFTVERLMYRICPPKMFLKLFMLVYNRSMRKNDQKRRSDRQISNL